jgi:glycosyltransferase involved in cell wall biosynthesis
MRGPAKPHIIVVALTIEPHGSSEPGKGWWWLNALRPYFTPHVVCQETDAQRIREVIDPGEEFHFYSVKTPVDFSSALKGYIQYWAYLKEALGICEKIKREFPIAGLCHLTLGSFRILPRYDKLGIPYTLGPIGGGECTPASMLWSRPVPLSHKLVETLRPVINHASALVGPVHACLKHASLVLVTSEETATVVRRIGARNAKAVFPDSYDYPIDASKVIAEKSARKDRIKEKIRLLWQGRLLWWKGPDIALEMLKAAIQNGLKVELLMLGSRGGYWETEMGKTVKKMAAKMGLTQHIRFQDALPREAFFNLVKEQDGFLATSLHDSGGIPLIEAQSRGIPCLTLGLGGNRDAACPNAGVSGNVGNVDDYIKKSLQCLAAWQKDPDIWLKECCNAVAFSQTFTNERLRESVRELIVPLFKS